MSSPSPALLEVGSADDVTLDRQSPSALQAAFEVIDQLVDDLRGARVAVVFSDGLGRVVDRRVTDPTLRAAFDHPAGPLRSQPLTRSSRTALTSATARVVDPASGRAVGQIALTCFIADASPLMQPLATRAAREIELRMVDDAGISKRLVLQRFLDERRRAKGPMVVVTDTSMMTNAAAARLISTDDEAVLRDVAARLGSGPDQGEAAAVELRGGSVFARGEPILDGPTRLGVVLRLRPVSDVVAGPVRSPVRPTFGWDSLTDTERTVTELAAEGLTNRDIGRQLFLSHHTVGFHLRAIFRKLDIGSRVELAGLVMRRELART
jgi:DNA-binding CsgD family transcriptional regulator